MHKNHNKWCSGFVQVSLYVFLVTLCHFTIIPFPKFLFEIKLRFSNSLFLLFQSHFLLQSDDYNIGLRFVEEHLREREEETSKESLKIWAESRKTSEFEWF